MGLLKKSTLFLAGDVMLGRGIDQILEHPSLPRLYESYVKNAKTYIALAEQKNGLISKNVPGAYLWGDGLTVLNQRKPQIRIINLETSITQSVTPDKTKGIHYKMHPENISALLDAKIDLCALANNHILDWSLEGLLSTIKSLNKAKIHYSGAGQNDLEAKAPAILPFLKGRLLFFSSALPGSGVPEHWAAQKQNPGIWLLNDLGAKTIELIKEVLNIYRQANDFCILSIHWGENWGYNLPQDHQYFAKKLIDDLGFNLIYGHSSHHPLAIELHNHCPILYGCGDLINDYEGIEGYEAFRNDLAFMYFLTFDELTRIKAIELVPFQRKKFSLHLAQKKQSEWLCQNMNTISKNTNTRFELDDGVIYCF